MRGCVCDVVMDGVATTAPAATPGPTCHHSSTRNDGSHCGQPSSELNEYRALHWRSPPRLALGFLASGGHHLVD